MQSNSAVTGKGKNPAYDIVYVGLFAVLIAVCSWISIPASVPFTLQTFGVFMSVLILGGRRGTLAVLVYVLLGAVGIPVFSGIRGGLHVLLGMTGGYIIGFIFTALLMWGMEKLPGSRKVIQIVSMLLGLVVCYTFGTIWFMIVYSGQNGPVGLMTVLGWCVIPFIIPDLIKIALAYVLSGRIRPLIRMQ